MEERAATVGVAAASSSEVDDRNVDDGILSEVLSMLDDDSDGLMEACGLFLTGIPNSLVDIEGALADGRLADAGMVAHRLRGTTGAFGARRLHQLAGDLERRCGEGDGDPDGHLLREMHAAFDVFARILQARLADIDRG